MSTSFPIQYYTGTERGPMNKLYVPDAAQTFEFNDLVFRASDGEIEKCGADPAAILGIAKAAAADKFLWANDAAGLPGRVPVSVLTEDVDIGLCVTGTPVITDEGKDYGIVENGDGNWSVDLSETTAAVFHVTKVDLVNGIYWGNFLATVLQDSAIGV